MAEHWELFHAAQSLIITAIEAKAKQFRSPARR